MARLVALLRGINVGKARRITMADLRRLVEAAGFGQVETLLASGNLLLEAGRAAPARVARRLEDALEAQAGFRAPVTCLRGSELLAILDRDPFPPDADDARVLVGLPRVAGALDGLEAELAPLRGARDAFELHPDALHVHCPEGVLESRVLPLVDRRLGDDVTFRNRRTLRRLAQRLRAD